MRIQPVAAEKEDKSKRAMGRARCTVSEKSLELGRFPLGWHFPMLQGRWECVINLGDLQSRGELYFPSQLWPKETVRRALEKLGTWPSTDGGNQWRPRPRPAVQRVRTVCLPMQSVSGHMQGRRKRKKGEGECQKNRAVRQK